MKFVALWSLKGDTSQAKIAEAIRRRAEFTFPEGVTLVAEYWSPREQPASVSILEADDVSQIIAASIYWSDYFSVDVFPVEEWETALKKLGKEAVG